MVDFENTVNPFEERRTTISGWRQYAAMDVEETALILQHATLLAGKGLKAKDALHIACAMAGARHHGDRSDRFGPGDEPMNTDTEVRIRGLRALVEALGTVEAERFITLILREPFDYTQWQRQLWTDRSVDELSKAAMAIRSASPNKGMEPTA
jgi:hypothetical protein